MTTWAVPIPPAPPVATAPVPPAPPVRAAPGPEAPPTTFLFIDPTRPPGADRLTAGPPPAVVLDLYGCAARAGSARALLATEAVLRGRGRHPLLASELWLRVPPSGTSVDAATLRRLGPLADGLIVPGLRSPADLVAFVRRVRPARDLPLLPVLDAGSPDGLARRLARHEGVVRLGWSGPGEGRASLVAASIAAGLTAGPVNGLSERPLDADMLLHDAAVAKATGFAGQCVTTTDLLPAVHALYRGR
ncbi:hypothetical protein [Streptomyces sp. NPDC058548]|uniref:hypothetical protein n=1 Tax=unclassified Streptomyces TaxID=2593676 RepID=UPI00364C6F00